VSSLDQGEDRRFRYRAVDPGGRAVSDVVLARDEPAALRGLMAAGLVVTRLAEEEQVQVRRADRDLRPGERVLLMRQLSLMLEAGVPLLEALETVAAGVVARRGRAQLLAVITALKGGVSLGVALRAHAPGFPYYVYAMAEVGEAAGRVAEVLRTAADQMAYEDRLRRDFVNALTYPAILACAGVAAVAFIFIEIVPRFSALIESNGGHMPLLSRVVFAIGDFVNGHLIAVAVVLGALATLVLLGAGHPAGQRRLYALGRGLPVIGGLLNAREVATWARLTAFAMTHGVTLLDASALSRQALPPGAFRTGLELFETELKAGVAVDASLGRHTALTPMDLSLLRAGAKSGALAAMFALLADSYDDRLKDRMKQFTALAEPAAIGIISIVVGLIALSLIMALASIYEAVS
jgi:type II secretory pathway component PulF